MNSFIDFQYIRWNYYIISIENYFISYPISAVLIIKNISIIPVNAILAPLFYLTLLLPCSLCLISFLYYLSGYADLIALIITFFVGFPSMLFFVLGCHACFEAFSLPLIYARFHSIGFLLSLPFQPMLSCSISAFGLSTLVSFFEFRALAIFILLIIIIIAHSLIIVLTNSPNLLPFSSTSRTDFTVQSFSIGFALQFPVFIIFVWLVQQLLHFYACFTLTLFRIRLEVQLTFSLVFHFPSKSSNYFSAFLFTWMTDPHTSNLFTKISLDCSSQNYSHFPHFSLLISNSIVFVVHSITNSYFFSKFRSRMIWIFQPAGRFNCYDRFQLFFWPFRTITQSVASLVCRILMDLSQWIYYLIPNGISLTLDFKFSQLLYYYQCLQFSQSKNCHINLISQKNLIFPSLFDHIIKFYYKVFFYFISNQISRSWLYNIKYWLNYSVYLKSFIQIRQFLMQLNIKKEKKKATSKSQTAVDQFIFALSGRLGKIQNQMRRDFHLKKKFSFKFSKFDQNYTKQIAMQIMMELTHEKNEIWGGYNEELVKNLGGNIHNVIQSILNEIHAGEQNNVDGDFDIIFNSEMPQNWSEEIILKLKKQIEQVNDMGFWILKDYLGLDNKAVSDNKSDAIHIFLLKRNAFIQLSEIKTLEEIMKKQMQKVRNAKEKQPAIKTYSQRFANHCLQNNMLFNISQLIKILYASANEIYKDQQFKDFSYLQIARDLRLQNKFNCSFQLSRKSHPKMIIYYVINNKMEKYQVIQNFEFFKPFLRHLFKREKAVLHFIGFYDQNNNEELKKQMKKMMEQIDSLKKQMREFKQQKSEKKEQI